MVGIMAVDGVMMDTISPVFTDSVMTADTSSPIRDTPIRIITDDPNGASNFAMHGVMTKLAHGYSGQDDGCAGGHGGGWGGAPGGGWSIAVADMAAASTSSCYQDTATDIITDNSRTGIEFHLHNRVV